MHAAHASDLVAAVRHDPAAHAAGAAESPVSYHGQKTVYRYALCTAQLHRTREGGTTPAAGEFFWANR